MSYEFIFTNTARMSVLRLDASVKKRIFKKLSEISSFDDIYHVSKSLSGNHQGFYRIRVGDYRLTCEIEEEKIFVSKVQHRKDVYR